MGYFDDDDDEEEELQQQQSHPDDDEEDPLDAYMKSLESTAASTASSNTAAKNRLDLHDDEDETWKAIRPLSTTESYAEENIAAEKAKETLNNTFHKAKGSTGASIENLQQPVPPDSNLPFQKTFWTGSDTLMGRTWRHEHQVTFSNAEKWTIDPILNFHELQTVLGKALYQQITLHYSTPTLVQSQTLPVALSGRDALVTAATGQGKTLAYLLSVLPQVMRQNLELGETGPIALVVVPTRELALQVQKQAKPLVEAIGLTSRAVIGGQGKYILRQELKKSPVHLVVATPGRLLDVVSDNNKGLSLHRVTAVVLDEADKMLQMGFETQVRNILQQLRSDRQTLMLSATMGRKIESVAGDWLQKDVVRISVGRTGEASKNVDSHVVVLPNEDAKGAFLLEMLPIFRDLGRTIVFVATREGCEKLASSVSQQTDVAALTLHGDKHQSDRNAAVRLFTRNEISILIATDVAARGLDIPNVQTVVSFDPAKNLDAHVHRVGRAGRLSKETKEQQKGSAYTLLTPKNADFAHVLRNAFEREGRPIAPELEELAQHSRKAGNVDFRSKVNKAGLGFVDETARVADDYDIVVPPSKRSRWS